MTTTLHRRRRTLPVLCAGLSEAEHLSGSRRGRNRLVGSHMLTAKGKYGLKAMVHLASAEPGSVVQIQEIADENDIPRKFLDAILGDLRHAGLLRSRKGRGGGYTLMRPAAEITLGDIVRALDGPLAPIGCASRGATYRACDDCIDAARCPVRLIMLQVRDATASVLDGCTLEQLRQQSLRNAQRVSRRSAKTQPLLLAQ